MMLDAITQIIRCGLTAQLAGGVGARGDAKRGGGGSGDWGRVLDTGFTDVDVSFSRPSGSTPTM
jgi:hypothetical protein